MILYNDLSGSQKKAVDVCVDNIVSGSRLTKIYGFAGTGKTTLASIIAERSEIQPLYSAYTGKAASVLSQKTGAPARTVHSLIMRYLGKQRDSKGNEELRFELDEGKASGLKGFLMVIDETSMIGQWLGERIMSVADVLDIPVLAIGDPFQLPPVKDVPYFRGRPDAMLTEVRRHEGIILDLADDIRQNASRFRKVLDRDIYDGLYAKATPRNKMGYLDFDQILVGRNETRHVGNLRMRAMRGYSDLIVPGEKIICLENNYRIGAYNGQQFTVLSYQMGRGRGRDRIWAKLDCGCNPDYWELECVTCGWNLGKEVALWADEFTYTGDKVKRPDRSDSWKAMVATYGYVLTVNKAQGSEWDSVLVIDETERMGGNHARWLYTAVTRASKELAIITY
jgi:exodeoxyribonuclease-5